MDAEGGHRERPKWMPSAPMRILAAAVVAVFGITYSTALDGQTYTNDLVCIGCLTVAVGICFWIIFDRALTYATRVLASVFAGLLLATLIVFAAGLPEAYRFQKRFNETMEQFHKGREQLDAAPRKP